MPDPVPSCFLGRLSAAPPASTASGPILTTSIYETYLGLAALSWSRTVLGLVLRAELRLPSAGAPSISSSASSVSSSALSSSDSGFDSLCFRIRPWLLWKRRGTKRFQLKRHHRTIDLAWDLTRAVFPASGGPEPTSGFFVAVAVDGEMFLIAGDPTGLADPYKKTKSKRPVVSKNSAPANGAPANPVLVSRREHVFLPDSATGRSYTTRAEMGGKEREISIDLGGGSERDSKMCIGFDGKRLLNVKRLRWKFRGNERVELEGGSKVQLSWDVHNWLFPSSGDSNPAATGHAVFVFRFDQGGGGGCLAKGRSTPGSGGSGSGFWGWEGFGSFGEGDLSSGGSTRSFGRAAGYMPGGKKRRGLLKTTRSSSASSLSASSSGSGSSVMEWASTEENELKESDAFSLLVYVWKR